MLDPRSRILAEIVACSDLEERIRAVPEWARCRGFLFESVERVLGEAGRLEEYRALVPARRRSTPLYPLTDYLESAAIGAALLTSPARLEEGLETIGRRNVTAISKSAIGRAMLRVLDPDPRHLLEQGMLGRRLSGNSARWYLSFPGPRRAIVTMRDEYIWIDSLLRGAALGTFEAIGVEARDEVELFGRFAGRHVLEW